ncbi:hypothetical protein P43SY_007570 [Pythium insidiosum]|uniref:Ankyrin repeat protein n=1 Tax=Pythium insidiosum TaxID=114742 RepID=A0AAD5Q817_PYTIN|nr:hypothetical protein P43SY_007570 [Pythium insidiosum]
MLRGGREQAESALLQASASDPELEEFLRKEAEEEERRRRQRRQRKPDDIDSEDTRLFMQRSWAEQRKIGTKAPVLRQVEGDSLNQRIRIYRRTVFFHIHGKWPNGDGRRSQDTHEMPNYAAKLDHNAFLFNRLRMNSQDPNGKDLEMRWTPLHYAVMGGHEKIVEQLLDKAPKNGTTPLMLVLLNASARQTNRDNGLLLQACGEDHGGIAKLLLKRKAFVDETDEDGWSAMHYAAATDSALAAEVLVKYDINLKARTYSTNETALELAERLRSHLVAILLYEVIYRKA